MDEIREHGQYVFWRDDARRVGYASDYKRRTRGKSGSAPADAEITDVP